MLAEKRDAGNLPAVTLAWAQSLNAVIAAQGGRRLALSSPESLAFTHRIRGLHQGILVGIGTVLADDPLLSVRLAEGPQPQPVVLDSALRLPPESSLLARTDRKPWVFHAGAAPARVSELEARGARLFQAQGSEGRLDLFQVMKRLGQEGVHSLMVEGGAQVIASFLASGLACQAVITVAPLICSGLAIFQTGAACMELVETARESFGPDLVIWGRPAPRQVMGGGK